MEIEGRNAVAQEDSALLRTARLVQFANHADKAINQVGFQEFDTWIQENTLRFGPSSVDELRDLKANVIDGTYDMDEARDIYQRLFNDSFDSVNEKSNSDNSAALSSFNLKERRARYGAFDREFDVKPYLDDQESSDDVEKGRVYVQSPEDVPDGYTVEEGERGGYYYEVDRTYDIDEAFENMTVDPEDVKTEILDVEIDTIEFLEDLNQKTGPRIVQSIANNLGPELQITGDVLISAASMIGLSEDYAYDLMGKIISEQKETSTDDGSIVGKDFSLDVYRVLPQEGEQQEDFEGNMLGFAVDFPNSDVYVEWNNKIFPDPLDDGHVSIYSSLEDLTTATGNEVELVDTVSQPDSIEKQSIEGYPELPPDEAAPEAKEFVERVSEEGFDNNDALLYQLLGSGTPEWKMSKEDAGYKEEPEEDMVCSNCQYYYVGTDGEAVCSKVRGQVYPEHWCRLWEAGDVKSDKSKADPLTDAHQFYGDEDRGGDLYCENEGASFEMDEVNEDDMCPWCGNAVSVFGGESKGAHGSDKVFDKFVSGSYHRRRKLYDSGSELSLGVIDKITNAHTEQVWPDELQKSPSWSSDDDVTQETQEWVNSVLELKDPMWDEYDGVPMAAGLTVKQEISESLTQHQGWSLNSIDTRLRKEFPNLEPFERRRIARQEVASILNTSKITALEARPDDPLVRWTGPGDSDSTELCISLAQETKDGVVFSKMKDLLKEYADEYNQTVERAEQGVPHFQCRYTIEVVE